jgi:hypothetical protein
MSRRFQFSLDRLFVATASMAVTMFLYLAATRSPPPMSVLLFLASCTLCGSALARYFDGRSKRPSSVCFSVSESRGTAYEL